MAERRSEVSALERRVAQSRASAEALGKEKELEAFAEAVRGSYAIMNRFLGPLSSWITGNSPLFLSYHRQVEAGRIPNGTEWDEQRAAAEAAINPYCFRELNFAALSLDPTGMTYYGPYAVVLREITIEDRASVFEENAFFFNRRHTVVAGTSPPLGYRAPWATRDRLAVAKLYAKVGASSGEKEFPEILLEGRRDQPDCDFIEVHIYGPINRAGIERVSGPKPKRRQDQALWRQISRVLRDIDVTVEET
jgi:hypothetical protein